MTSAVTDQLLRDLVVGSHAEGTTCLAVAAAIEHEDRVLLVAGTEEDFEPVWSLPADLVLPGETLLHALFRAVSLATGLDVAAVNGYTGHHDRVIDGEAVRTFVFTVTTSDPERVCRWANIGHRWSTDPITACTILGEIQAHPATNQAGPRLSARPRSTSSQLLSGPAPGAFSVPRRRWSC